MPKKWYCSELVRMWILASTISILLNNMTAEYTFKYGFSLVTSTIYLILMNLISKITCVLSKCFVETYTIFVRTSSGSTSLDPFRVVLQTSCVYIKPCRIPDPGLSYKVLSPHMMVNRIIWFSFLKYSRPVDRCPTKATKRPQVE